MFLSQRVRSFVCVRCDAFGAGDVDISAIARLVRLLSYIMNGLQLFFRVYEALVSSGNVIVHLDTEDIGVMGIANYLVRAVVAQSVASDAYVVSPILSCRKFLAQAKGCDHQQECCSDTRACGHGMDVS